jgi:hypothetical protein
MWLGRQKAKTYGKTQTILGRLVFRMFSEETEEKPEMIKTLFSPPKEESITTVSIDLLQQNGHKSLKKLN